MKNGYCWNCNSPLEFVERVFRNDTCPQCDSDVRCCLSCSDYDESSPNKCRESQAEKVSVKDRRNFCEYFSLRKESATDVRGKDRAAEARQKLEKLFNKLG
jgi:hypothetical protein